MFICRNDIETSFNLEIRIISPSMRGPWFGFNKVVDSDTTNFKDLVDEIVDKFPCGYGDVVKLFYFCADSKSNIEIHSDQDLMNMFAKHMTSKCHHMSIASINLMLIHQKFHYGTMLKSHAVNVSP